MNTDSPVTATNTAEIAAFPAVADNGAQDKPASRPSWIRRLIPRNAPDRSRPGQAAQTDPLLAFTSEQEPESRHARPEPRDHAAPDPGAAAAPRTYRVTWIRVALAALTLVALAQGVLIALWVRSGKLVLPAQTGLVKITSEPAGLPVAVDGTPRGATPFSLTLAPGAHQIAVGDGQHARTQTVEVAGGSEASMHVDLRPAAPAPAPAATTGGLQIMTDPAGARVSIDGNAHGASPLLVEDLAPGPHTVAVTSSSGSVTRRVTVLEGTVSSVIISLTATSEFASGWLTITSPITAEISEDGTLLGTTDIPRIMVPAGRHEIVLTNAALGYRAQRTVQITAGRTTSIALEIPRGTLHVNALPWAEVWIDGQRAGETPLGNVSLPIGTHQLLFRHPEFGEQRQSVVVTAGAPTRVGVDLRQ